MTAPDSTSALDPADTPDPTHVPPPTLVMDCGALLAYLRDEPGAKAVADQLERAATGGCRILMTVVSIGEAIGVIELYGDLHAAQKALAAVEQLPIEIRAVDEALALAAAHLRTIYELRHVASLVVALAIQEQGAVLTTDARFEDLAEVIALEQLPG